MHDETLKLVLVTKNKCSNDETFKFLQRNDVLFVLWSLSQWQIRASKISPFLINHMIVINISIIFSKIIWNRIEKIFQILFFTFCEKNLKGKMNIYNFSKFFAPKQIVRNFKFWHWFLLRKDRIDLNLFFFE